MSVFHLPKPHDIRWSCGCFRQAMEFGSEISPKGLVLEVLSPASSMPGDDWALRVWGLGTEIRELGNEPLKERRDPRSLCFIITLRCVTLLCSNHTQSSRTMAPMDQGRNLCKGESKKCFPPSKLTFSGTLLQWWEAGYRKGRVGCNLIANAVPGIPHPPPMSRDLNMGAVKSLL